ncbi:hypothetical protein Vretifemale_6519, partial [Volvox reticuliferus]
LGLNDLGDGAAVAANIERCSCAGSGREAWRRAHLVQGCAALAAPVGLEGDAQLRALGRHRIEPQLGDPENGATGGPKGGLIEDGADPCGHSVEGGGHGSAGHQAAA